MFLSRISGFAISLFLVFKLGISENLNPFYVTIAISTTIASMVSSLVEVHTVRISLAVRNINPNSLITSVITLGILGALINVIVIAIIYGNLLSLLIIVSMGVLPIGGAAQGWLNAKSILTKEFQLSYAPSFARISIFLIGLLLVDGVNEASVLFAISELPRIIGIKKYWKLKVGEPNFVNVNFLRGIVTQSPGSMATSMNPIVDRLAVDIFELGSVAILDLADKAVSFLVYVFTLGLLPHLNSEMVSENRIQNLSKIRKHLRIASLFIGCFQIATLVAISLTASLSTTAMQFVHLVVLYSFAAYFVCSNQLNIRYLVLNGGTRNTVTISFVTLSLNLIFDVVFVYIFGIFGIPLANIFTFSIVSKLSFLSIKKRI